MKNEITIQCVSICRLLSIEVTSLDDVYWLEDSKSSKIFGKDWQTWSKARQRLPTSKTALTQIKTDLWSTIVKTSQHQGNFHIVVHHFVT